MKALLTAIKTKLQTDLAYIRDGDIYITPHENYIPNHVRPPCVGIKDGRISRTRGMGGCVMRTMIVRVIVYVQLAKSEASIMGDEATEQNGILDIDADIQSALDNNLLSISGVQDAFCEVSQESELFGAERESLQRKIITVTYEQEE